MSVSFDANRPLGDQLQKWWLELQDSRGDRAVLCRAKTVTDIILLPVYHHTCMRFEPYFNEESNWKDRFAAVIGLLAHVRKTTEANLAQQMASPVLGQRPVVSELRFRRLIQRDRCELFISMVRVLRLMSSTANLHDLANSIYYWGDEVKRRWAFDYFPNTP